MRMRNALLVVLAGLAVGGPVAQAQIAPIVVRPARDHPGCEIYLKADGSRLLYRQQPVAAGGPCPTEFVRATVTRFGADSYRLQGRDLDCIITPQGQGRCTREPPRPVVPASAPSGPPSPAPAAAEPATPAPATPGPAVPAQPGGLPNPR